MGIVSRAGADLFDKSEILEYSVGSMRELQVGKMAVAGDSF